MNSNIYGPGFAFKRGDLVLANKKGYRGPGWDEHPHPAPNLPPDDESITKNFVYSDTTFKVKATRAAVFAVVRSLYVIDGPGRLGRFYSDNRMIGKAARVGREQDFLEPEQILEGKDLCFFRMLKAQTEHALNLGAVC